MKYAFFKKAPRNIVKQPLPFFADMLYNSDRQKQNTTFQ